MYQKILVPVDGSITSNSALQEAVKLAKRLDACLELVYVYEDAIYLVDENYFNYEELQKRSTAAARKYLPKLPQWSAHPVFQSKPDWFNRTMSGSPVFW